ncbi:unnamed protein product [Cylindrotheca closterium]|uniref:Protochlorophyllide reductase n=1 Tax=Cylindrotheca closterium TaxID=2856 RepID=A0AAD2FG16_9STRA|nr:unnamed protein product [Cylindrotheca closterium]
MSILVQTKLYHSLWKDFLMSTVAKVFVITGTASGTGNVAARIVAKLGGVAVLLNGKSERSNKSLAAMKEDNPEGKLCPSSATCKASSLSRKPSLRSRASTLAFIASHNAGIMATPDKATVNGYNTQMQTDHLSHFLLVEELMPVLGAGAAANVAARIAAI